MFDKAINLYKLKPRLGFKALGIYTRKAIGKAVTAPDFAFLNYYNLLVNNDFTHVAESGDTFKVKTKHGVKLFLRKYPSSDFQAIEQIWGDDEYAPVVNAIKKNFRQSSINIIDAGANVGYSSVYLFTQLKDYTINIIPVEPSAENVAVLQLNFKENGMDISTVEQAGLYNKSCYLDIVKSFRDGKDWSLQVQEVDHITSLPAIQVSDILKKQHWDYIDFLKMDIEGAERFLFSDKEYAASFLNKIKMIAIEIHHEYNIKDMICGQLLENGFSFYYHSELIIAGNKNYLPGFNS